MSSYVLRADALRIPLADESVDLIIESGPYYALRSYRSGGQHCDGQMGSESHPQQWLENYWAHMKECWRVLKPTGSCWVNLGDKRSGSGGSNQSGISPKSTLAGNGHFGGVGAAGPNKIKATRRNAPDRYEQAAFGRPKSKMLLPHRFAIGCEDGLADPEGIGWIVRQDQCIAKLNCLPESVEDRTRDSHEYFFHMTKQERYFSAVDEIREPHTDQAPFSRFGQVGKEGGYTGEHRRCDGDGRGSFPIAPGAREYNPLGKLPGSVWSVASEPLALPEYFVETGIGGMWQEVYKGTPKKPGKSDGELFEALVALEPVYPGLVTLWRMAEQRCLRGLLDPMTLLHVDHFAAFVGGTELVRRIMLGWSPHAICLTCGEGRRPVVDVEYERRQNNLPGSRIDRNPDNNRNDGTAPYGFSALKHTTILGYSCACTPFTDHPGSGGSSGLSRSAAIANGVASASTGQGWGGEQNYSARPPVGPWREYHLDGWTQPPSRPAVVLDPFGGSGTVGVVANSLDPPRTAILGDLSWDYVRLAKWRMGQRSEKVVSRTWSERQGSLLL